MIEPHPFERCRPGGPHCPWITAETPGVGGELSGEPTDFIVDEVPAYPPSGEGDHFFARVKKTGLSTGALKSIMAEAAGIDPREIGNAGRKDKAAVTTQWLSLPTNPVAPDDPRIELLEVARHPHKLRIGHLRGNHFRIRLYGIDPEGVEHLPSLKARLEVGVPNYFGPQRFAEGGRGLVGALAFLANPRRRVRDPKFMASVAQSAVFNHWLGARVMRGALDTALTGDVLKKRETGGLFDCDDVETDAARVSAGEVDPTGPMIGRKMRAASADAGAYEAAAAADFGLDERQLKTLLRWNNGSRRVARIVPESLQLEVEDDVLEARFFLRKGCFATVILAELAHPPDGDLRRRS